MEPKIRTLRPGRGAEASRSPRPHSGTSSVTALRPERLGLGHPLEEGRSVNASARRGSTPCPHPPACLPHTPQPPYHHRLPTAPAVAGPSPNPAPQSPLTRRHLSTEPQADPRKSQVLSPAFTGHRPELPSAPRPPPGPQSSTATTLVLGIQVSPYSIRGEGVHPKRSQKRSAPVLIRPETPPSRYRAEAYPCSCPASTGFQE